MIQLIKRLQNVTRKVKPAADPARAYDEALDALDERHRELREAAAGVLYVRVRLEADLIELRAEIGRLHSSIRSMIRSGNEARALVLVAEKQRLGAELEKREAELEEVKGDANHATAQVVASADERRNLQREKLRTIAAISVARARKRAAELRELDSVPRKALEQCREEVARLEGESHLDRELGNDILNRELGPGFESEDARTELARIRASMKPLRVA